MSRWAPGKKTPKSVGRAYVGFWFHCSPNPTFEREIAAMLEDGSYAAIFRRHAMPAPDALPQY
ncbi:hypothetical protein HBN77_22135 [Pseudomonas sp. WS 5018]|nr:hypothetical protein [Stutzerimonas stutzeri]NMY66715.1 hypothetical protein [Pseudomonas sp. WS 5018]RAA00050.1 hypothetical protein DOT40_21785 [Stutzerimonas stutzeri]TGY07615.1 hypothetical protein E5834_21860 [Stutzerimonas stutzeri]HAV07051.1 hypothetical protein [Pseudomonas sp.]